MGLETKTNVIALPGYSIPTPQDKPVESVVNILREYLTKAELGEVRAVIIASVSGEGTNERIESDFSAAAGKAWTLFAALGRVTRRFESWLDE